MLNEECGEECFGFCMNTGVCNLCGQDMSEFAKVLGERIKMVILCVHFLRFFDRSFLLCQSWLLTILNGR